MRAKKYTKEEIKAFKPEDKFVEELVVPLLWTIAVTPAKAYLFDIDGVLTNPEAKGVEQKAIFDELIKRLNRKNPLGLNTGRSLEFIIEQVLEPLEVRLKRKNLLQNIFAVGEKGAAWITYNEDNTRVVNIDKSISVPQEVQNEIRELVDKPLYNNIMFYDETKKTMASTELRSGKTILQFQEPQRQLVIELRELLTRHGLQGQFRVDPTRIATDVESIHVGKALGAKRFVELLDERSIKPEEYIGFGDSSSDYEMYEELLRLRKNVRFVFVGGKEHLVGKPQEGVILTKQHVDLGTLEFLQSEN